MTDSFFDLSSVSELRPISGTLAVLGGEIDAVSSRWLVIGATARDLLLHYARNLPMIRATADVDVAVAVSSWKAFELLSRRVTAAGGIRRKDQQRFVIGGVSVDVVPFGGVAVDGEIAWPPDGSIRMNVLGLREADRHPALVRLPGDFVVRVASVPALALLKVIAWEDRHGQQPRRDAVDLRYLLGAYTSVRDQDRLYGEGLEFLDKYSFDVELAAAALLGRDVGLMAEDASRSSVSGILVRELDGEKLAIDMTGDADRNLALLGAFQDGLNSE